MRIAVLLRDRCKSKRCAHECIKYCPRVRAGDETIVMGEEGKPIISEELCVGCGICINKCPYDAIKIIGLAEELATSVLPDRYVVFIVDQVSGELTQWIETLALGETDVSQRRPASDGIPELLPSLWR